MAESSPDLQISQEDSVPTSPTFIKPTSSTQSPVKLKASSRDDFEESSRPGKRQRLQSPHMTAAAALAEEQQKTSRSTPPPTTGTSPNPTQQALSALMGANQHATSKAESRYDAPSDPSNTVSGPLAVVAENIQKPTAGVANSSGTGDNHALTSPASLSSVGTIGTLEGVSGMTTTVGGPLPIEETVRQVVNAAEAGSTSPSDLAAKAGALSYPNPFLQPAMPESGRRGMSLPHSGTRQGTKSPSSKKHRCPYCATEFTRHHNLKSHLLTHSQEKPYVCSTCSSRFRRLHDLKRHTKLHTGERPHICPKCGRKFARGDALARHNKGPGGCAGRRASMGSFGGDEDGEGDDSMEGVMYEEPPNMDDEEGNERRPTPSIRRQAPSGDDTLDDSEHASRMPSTYPPIQGRPPGGIVGSYFAPRPGYNQPAPGASTAPAAAVPVPFAPISGPSTSSRPSIAGSVFAQNPMTESPKPLSPGQAQRVGSVADSGRNRSPSTTFYPQPHPRSTGSGSSLSLPPGAPQLPPPHTLNPPDARYTLPSQGGPAHPPTQPSGPPTHMSGSGPLSSHSNSLSSHGQSGHGSAEAANPMFAHPDRLWAYVTNLEQRINTMQEEINSLKHQLANATQQQPQRA
jgi:DNA-directed RNA polymerase subunit RPC12/RpoP